MAMKPFSETMYQGARRIDRYGTITEYPHQVYQTKSRTQVVTSTGDYVHPTSHAYHLVTQRSPVGVVEVRYGDGSKTVLVGCAVGSTQSTGELPTTFAQRILDVALVQLYERLRDSDVNLTTDLLQWRQTAAMVAAWKGGVKTLASHAKHYAPVAEKAERAMKILRSKDLSYSQRREWEEVLARAQRTLSDAHLQYIYGVKPTMNTICDLGELASRPPRGHPALIRVEGGYANSYSYTKTGTDKPATLMKVKISERARIVCYFNPPPSVLDDMAAIATLNPVSMIYEMTPYSFCLDWFTNTGNWMQAIETAFLHRNDFVSGYKSQGYYAYEEDSREGIDKSTFYRLQSFIERKGFRRTPLSSAPFPIAPRIKQKFGLDQGFALLALVGQKVRLLDRVLKAF